MALNPFGQAALDQRLKEELGFLDRFRFRTGIRQLGESCEGGEGFLSIVAGNHSASGRMILALSSHRLYTLSPVKPTCAVYEASRLRMARPKPPRSLEVVCRGDEILQLDGIGNFRAQHFITMFNGVVFQDLWGKPLEIARYLPDWIASFVQRNMSVADILAGREPKM